jgi:hypothetical protein
MGGNTDLPKTLIASPDADRNRRRAFILRLAAITGVLIPIRGALGDKTDSGQDRLSASRKKRYHSVMHIP